MVDRKVVIARLSDLADRVARARAHAKPSADELASDRDALDLVSFNLMLAVQACADIASHVIADQGWLPARTLADAFARLAERGVIDPKTQAALTRAVGLRNVVAQGYAGSIQAASTAPLRKVSRTSILLPRRSRRGSLRSPELTGRGDAATARDSASCGWKSETYGSGRTTPVT